MNQVCLEDAKIVQRNPYTDDSNRHYLEIHARKKQKY